MSPQAQTRRAIRRFIGLFAACRDLAATKCSRLSGVDFSFCSQVKDGLTGRARMRAFMHVEHQTGTICVAPEAARLPDENLAALFLHELGHLATNGGDSEADAWVFEKLGIVIRYEGPLDLERITELDLRKLS